MKKKRDYLIFLLCILIIFNLSLFCAILVPNQPEVKDIDKEQNVGQLLGFGFNDAVRLNDAVVTKLGSGKVEVSLKEIGNIKFSDKHIFSSFDDSFLFDTNSPAKFVFQNGRLIEASFKLANGFNNNGMLYSIINLNGHSLSVPSGGQVNFKDNKITITSNEDIGVAMGPAFKNQENFPSLIIDYVANGKDTPFDIYGMVTLPLKEGILRYDPNSQFHDPYLIGEKIVLGDYNGPFNGMDQNVFKNVEIKNIDPEKGLRISTVDSSSQDLSAPYIAFHNVKNGRMFISACAISADCGANANDYFKGLKIDHYKDGFFMEVSADSSGNAPKFTFNKGNSFFSDLNDGQSITLTPGYEKTKVYSTWNSGIDGKRAEYVIAYSAGTKVDNSGNLYEVRKQDGKYEWYGDRNVAANQYDKVKLVSNDYVVSVKNQGSSYHRFVLDSIDSFSNTASNWFKGDSFETTNKINNAIRRIFGYPLKDLKFIPSNVPVAP
jgi:hypothetical protein